MNVTFEDRRLYVAPRKSVLFSALVGQRRLRCYVQHAALIEPQRAPRDESEAYKHYLSAYDRNKDLIHAAARRLIEANVLESDGAVIVSRVAIELEDATALAPTARFWPDDDAARGNQSSANAPATCLSSTYAPRGKG